MYRYVDLIKMINVVLRTKIKLIEHRQVVNLMVKSLPIKAVSTRIIDYTACPDSVLRLLHQFYWSGSYFLLNLTSIIAFYYFVIDKLSKMSLC